MTAAVPARGVLHVMRTAGISGAERHLAILIDGLRAHGWQSDVLLATPRPQALGELTAVLQAAGAGTRIVVTPRDPSARLLRAIARAFRDPRYDVVHSHLVHADWHVGLAGVALRHPALVSTKHNHDPFRTGRAFRTVERIWIRRSDATIAISGSLAEFVERWSGVRPETVLYGLPAGSPPGAVPRAAGLRRLLAVGRLERQKGFDLLIEAMGIARDRGAHVVLRIAGEGTQRPELEQLIRARGLGDRIELLGQRTDVPALMREADVLVHPARWEGFGLVLLEAMREGMAIVASATGAIPEVVEDGRTAILVAVDDAPGLAEAIARVAGDDDVVGDLGAAGYRRLAEIFTPEAMAMRTSEIYQSAIERAAMPAGADG